jgi:hypothetical protein
MKLRVLAVVALWLLVLALPAANAQVATASILDTVTDRSGGPSIDSLARRD